MSTGKVLLLKPPPREPVTTNRALGVLAEAVGLIEQARQCPRGCNPGRLLAAITTMRWRLRRSKPPAGFFRRWSDAMDRLGDAVWHLENTRPPCGPAIEGGPPDAAA